MLYMAKFETLTLNKNKSFKTGVMTYELNQNGAKIVHIRKLFETDAEAEAFLELHCQGDDITRGRG